MVKPFAEALLRLLQNFGIVLEPIVDLTEHLAQLLLNELGIVVQCLAQLHAQLIDLLLHEQQGLGFSRAFQEGTNTHP
jgi:hypothetical protein